MMIEPPNKHTIKSWFDLIDHCFLSFSFSCDLVWGNVPNTLSQRDDVMPNPFVWIRKWWFKWYFCIKTRFIITKVEKSCLKRNQHGLVSTPICYVLVFLSMIKKTVHVCFWSSWEPVTRKLMDPTNTMPTRHLG